MTATYRLTGPAARAAACRAVMAAGDGDVVEVRKATRTTEQNALLWACLTAISAAKPGGRALTPDTWKALFMHACNHEVAFAIGLNGEPFPLGFRSSRLTKRQMADLLDFIGAWAAENGIRLERDAA